MKNMKRNRIAAIMLLASMLAATFAIFPSAFAGDWETDRFDLWGPRVDQIRFNFSAGPTPEFTALQAHDIDITDWPLTRSWVDDLASDTDIEQDWFGGERGMFNLDINQNETMPDGSYNPFGDPTVVEMTITTGPDEGLTYTASRGYHFAHALGHLLKRDEFITTVLEGLGEDVYAWMPEFYGDNKLGSQASIDAGYSPPDKHPYSPSEAANILDLAGFTDNDGDGWRDIPGTNTELNIDFVYRFQHTPGRMEMGLWVAEELENINVDVTLDPKDGAGAFTKVMVGKNFHLYTGGWSLGLTGQHFYGIFHSSMYWDSGLFCLNYGHHNDATHDYWAEESYFAATQDDAMVANWELQTHWVDPEHIGSSFSVWAAMAPKASLIPCVNHPGETWKNMVNERGFGINAYLTFLNMHPNVTTSGGNLEYGMYVSQVPGDLNPFYASWYPDYEVITKIYDTPLLYNPYHPSDLSRYMGFLAYDWDVGTWNNPDNPDFPTSTVMTLKFRSDVTWHDGTPFTAADVNFTIAYAVEAADVDWYSAVQYVHHTEVPDPYTIVVYMDVESVWTINWLGVGFPIVPKHIWEPIVETGDPYGFCPDPQLIGTGMFKVYPHSIDPADNDYYVPFSYLLMDKNPDFYRINEWILGDLDGDGDVDYMDLFAFKEAYIELVTWDIDADFDHNFNVDYMDLFAFKGFYITAP